MYVTKAHQRGEDKMKARLLENRPGYAKLNGRYVKIRAGEKVTITGIDPNAGRFLAEYKGHYVLNFMEDQGEPIDD